MNLVEHYITEVHSIELLGNERVVVDLTINCYGNISRKKLRFNSRSRRFYQTIQRKLELERVLFL